MKTILTPLLAVMAAILLSQCNKTTETDKALFNKVSDPSGFTYYKLSDSLLPSSSPSAHNPYFKVRYNAIAFSALTDSGKLPVGSTFPEGSLIVKELYDSPGGSLALLAVMEKASGNSAAGSGYLWGEYKPDGKAVFSTSKKGNGCISCHSASGHRDLNRLFELFPY